MKQRIWWHVAGLLLWVLLTQVFLALGTSLLTAYLLAAAAGLIIMGVVRHIITRRASADGERVG